VELNDHKVEAAKAPFERTGKSIRINEKELDNKISPLPASSGTLTSLH